MILCDYVYEVSMILKLHFKDKIFLSEMIVEIPSEKGHGSKMEERKRGQERIRRGREGIIKRTLTTLVLATKTVMRLTSQEQQVTRTHRTAIRAATKEKLEIYRATTSPSPQARVATREGGGRKVDSLGFFLSPSLCAELLVVPQTYTVVLLVLRFELFSKSQHGESN